MNVKSKTKLACFAVILFFIGSAGAASAQSADAPEQAAKSFYQWYTKELFREGGNPIKNRKTVLKSVSKRLGKWLYSRAYEEYGADYIIDAQDYDNSWQVSTTKAVIKGNTASLKILLKSTRPKNEGFSRTLPVKMVRENGEWKIDSVNNRSLSAD
jgi:hypothetical protein